MVTGVVVYSHHRTMKRAWNAFRISGRNDGAEIALQRRMNHLPTIFLAVLGLTLIYAGYELFCGLPVMSQRAVSRARVILLNMVPGVILTLAGAALFTTEARAMISQRSDFHRHLAPASDSAHPFHLTTTRVSRS